MVASVLLRDSNSGRDLIDLITPAKGNNLLVWEHINTILQRKTTHTYYEIKINNVLLQEDFTARRTKPVFHLKEHPDFLGL